MLGFWFIFVDRELLVAYVITVAMLAAIAFFMKRILLQVDPYATGLKPSGVAAENCATGKEETVTEYPQSGVPGRWQWRSE